MQQKFSLVSINMKMTHGVMVGRVCKDCRVGPKAAHGKVIKVQNEDGHTQNQYYVPLLYTRSPQTYDNT